MAEINVTPLVDVMLVLLIIFMITAPLMLSTKIQVEPAARPTSNALADRHSAGAAGRPWPCVTTENGDLYMERRAGHFESQPRGAAARRRAAEATRSRRLQIRAEKDHSSTSRWPRSWPPRSARAWSRSAS
jgi:biopolymer transport protein TolR